MAFFSEPLLASSVNASSVWLETADASVAYASTPRTATLTPLARLDAGADYTFRVSGVRDLVGNVQAVDGTAPFRTAGAALAISADTVPEHADPVVRFTPGGAGLVVWRVAPGSSVSSRVAYATYSPTSSTWSPPQLLDTATGFQDVVVSGERFAIAHYTSGGPSNGNVSFIENGVRTPYTVGIAGAVRLAANATAILAFWGTNPGTSASVFSGTSWSATTAVSTQTATASTASSAGFALAFTNGSTMSTQVWATGIGWGGLVQQQSALVGGVVRTVRLAPVGAGFALAWVMDFSNGVSIYARFSNGSSAWTSPSPGGVLVGAYALGALTYQASQTLGLSSDGTSVMAAWRECNVSFNNCAPKLMTRRYFSGAWQTATEVPTTAVPGTSDPLVLQGNPAGGYALLWGAGTLTGSSAAAGATSWAAGTTVATAAASWTPPQLIVRGTGYTAAWETVDSVPDRAGCEARTLSGGAWDALLTVASAPPTSSGCSVAAKGSDNVFAYSQGGEVSARDHVAGVLGTPALLSNGVPIAGAVETGRLALAGDGTAYAAWIQSERGVSAVFGSLRGTDGGWSPPARLGGPAYWVRVAGEGSTYLVAWAHDTGLFSRAVVAGAAPSPVHTFATTPVDYVEAEASGGFMLAWGRRTGSVQALEAATSADGLSFSATASVGAGGVSRFRLAARGGRFVLGVGPSSGAPRAATYGGGAWSALTTLGTVTLNDWSVATDGTTAMLAGSNGTTVTAYTQSGTAWTSQPIPTVGVGTFSRVTLGVGSTGYVAVVNGGSSSFVSWLGPTAWTSRAASFNAYAEGVACDASGCTAITETSGSNGYVLEEYALHAFGATSMGVLVDGNPPLAASTTTFAVGGGRWGAIFTARDVTAGRDRIYVHVDL